MALENAFKPVQRQGVGILGHQNPGQQLHAGEAFAQRVCRPWRGLDLLAAVFGIENGFFLPVFDHPGLSRNDVQLFLDLAEEGFTGSGLFLCVQLKMNLDARQVLVEAVRLGMPLTRLFRFFRLGQFLFHRFEGDFQLGFVEQLALERQFLAACAELAQPRQAQLFFQQQDVFAQFGVEGLSLFEQRLLFGEFGFLMGKPHLLIGKKMIFFFENPKQIGRGEWRWRRWIQVDVRRRFHGTNYNIIICLAHQKVAS